MNENEERYYLDGQRSAYRRIFEIVLKELGYDGSPAASLIVEREAAIAKLREICAEVGDNEWDESLHLADIIDKHLGKHLLSISERP